MRFANPLNFFSPRAAGGGIGRYSDLFLVAGVAAISAMMLMRSSFGMGDAPTPAPAKPTASSNSSTGATCSRMLARGV